MYVCEKWTPITSRHLQNTYINNHHHIYKTWNSLKVTTIYDLGLSRVLYTSKREDRGLWIQYWALITTKYGLVWSFVVGMCFLFVYECVDEFYPGLHGPVLAVFILVTFLVVSLHLPAVLEFEAHLVVFNSAA